MKNYGIQCGTVRPQEIQITPESVFIAENIEPYTSEIEGHEISGFKYNYIQYTKDEYILKLAQANLKLEQDLIDTQLALCDLYESFGGDEE